MELKVVYRILRKISDWTLDGYYSEVVVEGKENVPERNPLIIASTHHNDLIDIATLAATIPYRRHLYFWAKSTMFKNPIAGAILSSSGAIPVKRNPNSVNATNSVTGAPAGTSGIVSTNRSPKEEGEPGSSSSGSSSPSASVSASAELDARATLFRETSNVLESGGVVGLFPEGGSYTGWRIFQVMPGAAWAAVEYMRAVEARVLLEEEGRVADVKGKGKARAASLGRGLGLQIVPVAITYTGKDRYLSRVHVRYGEPIMTDAYWDELFDPETDPNVASRVVVKKITAEMELRLTQMTINALDWETVCATEAAINILWGDEDAVPLKEWVDINQRLVAALDGSDTSSAARAGLSKYYSLLHHSGVTHSNLTALVAYDNPYDNVLSRATWSVLHGLPLAVARFLLFLPPFLLFLPGYVTGPLAAKVFTDPYEKEAPSQFKAIAGGLGIGLNISFILHLIWRMQDHTVLRRVFFGEHERSAKGRLSQLVQAIGVTYYCVSALVKWHNLLINSNYRRFQRLQTYWILLKAYTFRRPRLDPAQLAPYTKPPHPVINPFIKQKHLSLSLDDSPPSLPSERPLAISSSKLIPYLLEARREACLALSAYLRESQNETLLDYLIARGARLPSFV